MATQPSDHSSAESDPGSSAPLVQPPEAQSGGGGDMFGAGTAGGPLPNATAPEAFVQPVPGQNPSAPAQTSTPLVTRRPQGVIQGEPPLGKGWGVDQKILIGQANQLPHDYGGAGAQVAAGQQANLVPIVAVPVLSRLGPQYNSHVAAVPLNGLSIVNVRTTYHDLKITAGFRGLQIQYPQGVGGVSIRENVSGMVYTLPSGPQTIFVPLFMTREICDLTITSTTGFGNSSTALLTTEEQIPFDQQGSALTSTNLSGTIAVSNTFQSIQTANAARRGGTIQNNGAANMFVFFGPITNASLTNSFIIPPGQSIQLGAPSVPGALTDQVSITGTATQAFVANFQ
jgi:hypothetical protein